MVNVEVLIAVTLPDSSGEMKRATQRRLREGSSARARGHGPTSRVSMMAPVLALSLATCSLPSSVTLGGVVRGVYENRVWGTGVGEEMGW